MIEPINGCNNLIDLTLAYNAINSANDGMTIVDMRQEDQPLIFINKAFEEMTGYKKKEVLGRNCRFLQGDLFDQPERKKIHNTIQNHKNSRFILKNFKKDGTLFWNELSLAPIFDPQGQLTYYVGIQKDMTHEILQQEKIKYLSEHDDLTGLYNYRTFFKKIDELCKRGRKLNFSLGIGIADIDQFKKINDEYGHLRGNQILKLFGVTCNQAFRENDIASRFGGDEFCFAVLSKYSDEEFFYEKINRIVKSVNELLPSSLNFSMSTGIVIEKIRNSTNIDHLIRLADQVMYKNKQSLHL